MSIPAEAKTRPQFVNVRLPGDLALLLHQLSFERRMSKTALVIQAIRNTYEAK